LHQFHNVSFLFSLASSIGKEKINFRDILDEIYDNLRFIIFVKNLYIKGLKMSFAILGGILLNIGAFLTFKGMIFRAVFIYLIADICWVIMAYERNDYWGMLFILIGIFFGLLAYWKMKNGKMQKELDKK
jgi:uncharacterized Tic20 family protein